MKIAAFALSGLLVVSATVSAQQAPPVWELGAFVDLAYLKDFNSPDNHLFRGRGTTPRLDEPDLNMAAFYIRKKTSDLSRWGLEVTAQAGEDTNAFGFSSTAPNIAGADWLRHLGPTNVSYLAPIGRGLTLQGGVFNSFVGYDTLYAKDNFNYTRPWGADFTPYLMLGANGSYPLGDRLTVVGFVVNGYWHLAHANDVPSVGGQIAAQATERLTVKQTVLYGPHQSKTSLGLWRFLSDTIVERKSPRMTTAVDFQASEERAAESSTRAWWISVQAPVHWSVRGPVSATVRPEFSLDSRGRWTSSEQSIGALTSTLEYRRTVRRAQAIFRLEHRYDRSTGPAGGFYAKVGLKPGQHLVIAAGIFTFDAAVPR